MAWASLRTSPPAPWSVFKMCVVKLRSLEGPPEKPLKALLSFLECFDLSKSGLWSVSAKAFAPRCCFSRCSHVLYAGAQRKCSPQALNFEGINGTASLAGKKRLHRSTPSSCNKA